MDCRVAWNRVAAPVLAGAVAASLCWSHVVRADEPTNATLAPSVPAPPVTEWYGAPIVALDAVAVGAALVAEQSSSKGVSFVSDLIALSSYTLGAPIVHGAHGRAGVAFASLGLRLAVPVLAAFVGSTFRDPQCVASSNDSEVGFDHCEAKGAFVGLLAGMVAMSIFDVARARVAPAPSSSAPPAAHDVGWVQSMALVPALTSTTTSLGLVGRF